jgi:hypothetical protein
VNTAERSLVILKHVYQTPSLAACSKCQRKVFTPNSYFNDRIGADSTSRTSSTGTGVRSSPRGSR